MTKIYSKFFPKKPSELAQHPCSFRNREIFEKLKLSFQGRTGLNCSRMGSGRRWARRSNGRCQSRRLTVRGPDKTFACNCCEHSRKFPSANWSQRWLWSRRCVMQSIQARDKCRKPKWIVTRVGFFLLWTTVRMKMEIFLGTVRLQIDFYDYWGT